MPANVTPSPEDAVQTAREYKLCEKIERVLTLLMRDADLDEDAIEREFDDGTGHGLRFDLKALISAVEHRVRAEGVARAEGSDVDHAAAEHTARWMLRPDVSYDEPQTDLARAYLALARVSSQTGTPTEAMIFAPEECLKCGVEETVLAPHQTFCTPCAIALVQSAAPTPSREATEPVALAKALASAVNSVSAENGSDTPDFILGDFLAAQLEAFNNAVHRRSQWYGHHQSIASPPSAPREPSAAMVEAAMNSQPCAKHAVFCDPDLDLSMCPDCVRQGLRAALSVEGAS